MILSPGPSASNGSLRCCAADLYNAPKRGRAWAGPPFHDPVAGPWKGRSVIEYRSFRNGDPPGLVQVWNQCFTGRGAALLRGSTLLEFCTLSKPYFDPAGLIVAVSDGRLVGFAHAGFGPAADQCSIDPTTGVLCMVAVLPDCRRQGIGGELLRRAEEYLRAKGATTLRAGPRAPYNPFTFGVYGGSSSPGFLDSDSLARPFFDKHGYQAADPVRVLQRSLDAPLALVDVRFSAFRQQFEIHARALPPRSWWQECVIGPIEMVEYRLVDKARKQAVAQAVMWEMETFRARYQVPAVGVAALEVPPESRRRGLGKFLTAQIIRHLQEQAFKLLEVQVAENDPSALGLAGLLGFQQVDLGRAFVKKG